MATVTTKDGTSIYYKDWGTAVLKVYPGLPHGMCSTHKDVINADLPAFIKG